MLRQKRKLRQIEKAGTKTKPRLNVFRSNKYIYASVIDDKEGKTLVRVSEKDVKGVDKLVKSEKAFLVGKTIAEKAIKKGLKTVVFDRAGYLYHGRVKALADGAREGGLEF